MQLWINLFFNFQQCWSGLLLQLCDPLRGALRAPPPRSGEVALLTNSCFSHCSPLCNKTRSCAEVSSSTFYFRTRSCSSSPSSTSAAPPAGRSVCMSFWFTPVSFRVVDRNFYTVLKKKQKKKTTISCAAALKTKYLTFVCLCTPAAGTSSSTCVYYNYYYTNFTNTGPVFYLLSFNNNLKYNRSTSIRYMNITLRYCSVSLKQHGCWVDVLKYYISEVQMWGRFIYICIF